MVETPGTERLCLWLQGGRPVLNCGHEFPAKPRKRQAQKQADEARRVVVMSQRPHPTTARWWLGQRQCGQTGGPRLCSGDEKDCLGAELTLDILGGLGVKGGCRACGGRGQGAGERAPCGGRWDLGTAGAKATRSRIPAGHQPRCTFRGCWGPARRHCLQVLPVSNGKVIWILR